MLTRQYYKPKQNIGKNLHQPKSTVSNYSDIFALPKAMGNRGTIQALAANDSKTTQLQEGFKQAPSKAIKSRPDQIPDAYLGTRCYAYALLNACKSAGYTPEIEGEIMNQESADDWIRNSKYAKAGGTGGGPQGILKELNEQGMTQFRVMIKIAPSKFYGAVSFAVSNSRPFVIAATVNGSAKHWIYGIDARTDLGSKVIIARDQQNTDRGDLEFKFNQKAKKWISSYQNTTYSIDNIMTAGTSDNYKEFDKYK